MINAYEDYAFYKQLEHFHKGDVVLIAADVHLALGYMNYPREDLEVTDELIDMFPWRATPEGREYWYERHHSRFWKPADE